MCLKMVTFEFYGIDSQNREKAHPWYQYCRSVRTDSLDPEPVRRYYENNRQLGTPRQFDMRRNRWEGRQFAKTAGERYVEISIFGVSASPSPV